MIVTGTSLLGQILTTPSSSGLLSAKAAVGPAGPSPQERPGPDAPSAPVTVSPSTLDALFALQVSSRGANAAGAGARADQSARSAAPSSGAEAGSQATVKAQTVVDPDLVRAIAAALESQKSRGDGTGLTVMSQSSTGSLQTSVSRQNSLKDILDMAGRAQQAIVDLPGQAALH